jgi:hypothetical protein
MAVGKEIKSPVKVEDPTATAQRFLDQCIKVVIRIIFCHRTNDLANPVLSGHLHDPDNDLSLLRL